jgi:hypothetical protein
MRDIRPCALEGCNQPGTVELPPLPHIHPRHTPGDPHPARFCARHAAELQRQEFGLMPMWGVPGKPYARDG